MESSNPIIKNKPYLVLSGGKTMGHISPLLAIYQTLKKDYQFIYFGLPNSMEARICEKYQIKFVSLALLPFFRKNIKRNYYTFKKIKQAKKKVLNELNNKDVKAIITSGGYVSIPVFLASKKIKCHKVLLEANAVMGLANQYLKHYADIIITQFPIKKTYNWGYPTVINQTPFEHPFFYQNKPLILFMGGSNGALEIVKYAYEFHKEFPEYNYLVLCGEHYYELYEFMPYAKKYRSIVNVSAIFKYCSVIVSRSGGASIAELRMTKSKAVLIPSLNVSNHHQEKNANALKEEVNFIVANDYDTMKKGIIKHLSNPNNEGNYQNSSLVKLIEFLNV